MRATTKSSDAGLPWTIGVSLERYAEGSIAVQLLSSIPGVGIRTDEAVADFIDDPNRYSQSKQLGFYFGLVPMHNQSDNKNRLGYITREGSAIVRHLLTKAVWQSLRRSLTIKASSNVSNGNPQFVVRLRSWPQLST